MTAKQYLKQAYRLNELIDTNIEELETLRALSTSIKSQDYSQDRVQTSQAGDKIGDIVAKIIDLENKINNEIDRFVALKDEIRQKIEVIENKDERLILQKRYLCFLKWERIAEDLEFTTQWIHELHKRALTTFSQIHNL